ncbi:MAG: iron-containing alcohol dehydrogenase [Prevotella sp.]|nr:iron-containing alcohol dehydrogenase [Prevotella sp.]MDY4625376.1 iron-containing alcohol dehydrogenase [Prevotella sp.]MDY5259140.1 iron-containing alcohol dehydrogenase [Prevotella sp.]
MRDITLLQPQKIVFGTGCIKRFTEDFLALGHHRLMVVTLPFIRPMLKEMTDTLAAHGVELHFYEGIKAEPTVADFETVLNEARQFEADSFVGIGGGSVLDVTKLVATLCNQPDEDVTQLFGTGKVKRRGYWFACMPTTSGTGSEVSPNAILLDETDNLKKGVVSPYLMADAAYIDPQLTWTVPAKVTAETGMDALTHCIEAYTNKFAHPCVDMYALQGIRLIAANIARAVKNGNDVEAREAMSLGSMYGGLCLGPVNTAAVHALSYPLGGEFHLSHGLSNALLLPSVMRFNYTANVHKYAEVAVACGVERADSDEQTALRGVDWIERLSREIGIPAKLTELGVPQSAVAGMAKAAMNVQRLLRNNPREVTEKDAYDIYMTLY